jgi:hypothetical protein
MQNTITPEPYTIIDNGDDTYSLWGKTEQTWIELDGQEDMTYRQAWSLHQEYIHS